VPEVARISEVGGFRVEHHAVLDSTNRHLLDAARAGAPDRLVVVADHQTAGRGRLGRRWEAPPGSSLLVSVLLRDPPGAAPAPAMMPVMTAALALAHGVEATAGFAPALKWPNDLVVADRKLAGLLAERDGDAVVVGAGCNVNWAELPPELAETATACNLEAGRAVDRDALLAAYLHALADGLDAPGAVGRDYRARLATIGRRVRVERDPARDLVGEAVALDDDGALVVRADDGVRHTVAVGDVVHLR